VKCWEHLLPGEPWQFRKSDNGVEELSADTILAEKHLDMPASWVKRLDVSNVGKQSCKITKLSNSEDDNGEEKHQNSILKMHC
jgi:hypothetical protein